MSIKIRIRIQRYGDVKNTLKDLNERYEYVITDVAGHDSKELRTAMLVTDLMIVPFRPSQFDLDTLLHLTEVIDQAQSFNENLIGILFHKVRESLNQIM